MTEINVTLGEAAERIRALGLPPTADDCTLMADGTPVRTREDVERLLAEIDRKRSVAADAQG